MREVVLPLLGSCPRLVLTEPLDLLDMHNLMARCRFVMSDSGGLQEEAPALGVAVLVLRAATERPEAAAAGCVRLVGTQEDRVFSAAAKLLTDEGERRRMARAVSPYGDGHAAERIASHVSAFLSAAPEAAG